ncbi:Hydroxymethylglutaryl-CoA synthase [Sphingobium indicum BiD32]|uniref:Hydroxymethylglutaryl-CoA synthase n=1 Tax=Sphingobium indicum BiD32 TaxID=1301087 RepID=N1MF23_9SPHN|nr:3-oxoacyl-[acyl-carrier-protein] synthase III C-terminal domain-containing protein [Sphingobium indicum]CCW15830.1 Hydroxymethylglutaryl-CoA synthase [Sphingobium indicum BiD32]
MTGIIGFGGYVPRARLSRRAIYEANSWFAPNLKGRAGGHRAMANWDEDPITMVVAAARDCLGEGDDRSHVEALYFASTTAPFADRLNAGVVAAALTLNESVEAYDAGGTRRAGLGIVNQALARVRGGGGPSLALASDLRKARMASPAEMEQGEAGAAILLGRDNVLAEHLASASVTVDFVDHFRQSGVEFDYNWEERWVRDEGVAKIVPRAVKAVLERAGLEASAVDYFIFPTTLARMDAQIAKSCGIAAEAVLSSLHDRIGDTCTAHALLLLAQVLETARPGATILVVEFGNGAEALLFRVTEAINSFNPRRGVSGWLDRGREELNYTKLLAFRGLIEIEKGMRGEQDKKTALSTLYRHRSAILGLVGGKCEVTGSVHFPPSRFSYDQQKPLLDTQRPYKMAEKKAQVLSWSAEKLSFYLAPPHHYGQLDFEGGGRVLMEFTDVQSGDVDTGTEMEMTFRIKDRDQLRDFTRYFWKAMPVAVGA